MNTRKLVLLPLLAAVLAAHLASARADVGPDWQQYVLKVEVTNTDGSEELGSAIPLAGTRMITNCHVLRDAKAIYVSTPKLRWRASMASGDAYRDLCFLNVPHYQGREVPMAGDEEVRVGMHVLAVGYTDGLLSISPGQVKGLHTCPCDGGRVIQTSAKFDRGASGGGLFDAEGRLVGILTFKARNGGDFHFALPVGWLRGLAKQHLQSLHQAQSTQAGQPFWESSGKGSPYFLAACALDSRKNWQQLYELAADWTTQEPDNPEAWMSLGHALLELRRPDSAAKAFQRVLRLDSTHSGAQWELQKLEFELGRPLLG